MQNWTRKKHVALRWGLLLAMVMAVAGCAELPYPVPDYSTDKLIDWEEELGGISVPDVITDWKESRIITHALGRIDQYTYTNSKEALVENYKRGARVFEVDLNLTEEGRLVCVYEWKSFSKQTGLKNVAATRNYESVMQAKIHGKYTPMSFRNIAMMMKICPDVFIITDTKSSSIRRVFSALVSDAKSVDETILDRIIPQLYTVPMLDTIEQVHPFKEYIFTRYKHGTWESRILALIDRRPEIKGVTFPVRRISPTFCQQLKARNVRAYTHTVNSVEEMKQCAALGVDGFYSDDLTDECVNKSVVFDTVSIN